MTRHRCSLLLLAVLAIVTTAIPMGATEDAALPSGTPAPEPATWLDADLCAESLAPPAAALDLAAQPNGDFILCTCTFCKYHPDTDCQISPKGYSILCADWYRRHC